MGDVERLQSEAGDLRGVAVAAEAIFLYECSLGLGCGGRSLLAEDKPASPNGKGACEEQPKLPGTSEKSHRIMILGGIMGVKEPKMAMLGKRR